jgi:hypothetical protein
MSSFKQYYSWKVLDELLETQPIILELVESIGIGLTEEDIIYNHCMEELDAKLILKVKNENKSFCEECNRIFDPKLTDYSRFCHWTCRQKYKYEMEKAWNEDN